MFKISVKKLIWISVIGIALSRLYSVNTQTLFSRPRPAKSYQESLQRIEKLKNLNSRELAPTGQLIFMNHGKKVNEAIVFFHGFTNSPRQFKALGEEFYKLGYNVLIPRLPRHGHKDRMAPDLGYLTAEELKAFCDESVDIARGLGERVTVVGLSMGGVMTGWAAQFRNDVDQAVLIAPNFGTYVAPEIFLKPTINLLLILPDRFVWWNPLEKAQMKGPESAYYGFSARALGEIRRLGWHIQAEGGKHQPSAGAIIIITNANDKAVNRKSIKTVKRNWRSHDPHKIRHYEFPKNLQLGHDLIDPEQPDQKIHLVYPKLLTLITGKEIL